MTVGYHTAMGGNKGGIGVFMADLDAAGIPFSMKSVRDAGLAVEAAEYARNSGLPHNIIYRIDQPYGLPDDVPNYKVSPEQSATDYWQHCLQTLNTAPELVPFKDLIWIELINEARVKWDYDDPNWNNMHPADWLGWFVHHLGKLVNQAGWKFVAFGMNAGEPEIEDWLQPGMIQYLQDCAENYDKLAISLHEGKTGGAVLDPIEDHHPFMAGRFQFLFAICDRLGIRRPRVMLSEWAWAHNNMPDDLEYALEDMRWIQLLTHNFEDLQGTFMWTLADGWGGISDKLQRTIAPWKSWLLTNYHQLPTRTNQVAASVQEYVNNMDFGDVPTPGPGPEPELAGVARIDYARTIVLWHQTAAADWITAARTATMAQGHRYTEGFSADDAGIGNVVVNGVLQSLSSRRVIAVNPDLWGNDPHGTGFGLSGFLNTYYPGVDYHPVVATTSTGATQGILAVLDSPTPPPPPPPPPPTLGLDNPVGTTALPSDSNVWPPYWVDSNPLGTFYTFGNNGQYSAYHTGADLNLNHPTWDSDRLAPVYAVEAGLVTCARQLGGTWGNIVVIRHPQGIYSRYAHLDEIRVSENQTVSRGFEIGRIGNSFGQLPYHLHFDLSLTTILNTNPGHWPGSDLKAVVSHYIEPKALIQLMRPGYTWPDAKTAYTTANANFRCGPTTNFRTYTTLAGNTTITVLNVLGSWALVRLSGGEYGWIHTSLITYTPPGGSGGYQGPPIENFVAGVDQPASDWRWPEGKAVFDTTKLTPKFHTQGVNPQWWSQYKNPHFNSVRILLDPSFTGGAAAGSEALANAIYLETNGNVQEFYNQGARDFIVLNEPNIEGMGIRWHNGSQFGFVFKRLCAHYLSAFPGIRLWYPGMSPGFGAQHAFINDSKAAGAFDHVYGVVEHVYTGETSGHAVSIASAMVSEVKDFQQRHSLTRPLVIGEFSVNRPASAEFKRDVYVEFYRQVAIPGVQAAYSFTSDWTPNPDVNQEGWLNLGLHNIW